jgi:hypothetical protein
MDGPKLSTKAIKELAKKKLLAAPGGVRWTTLVNEISAEAPGTPINTIWGSTQTLFKSDPDVFKLSKGIYGLRGTASDLPLPETVEKQASSTVEVSSAGVSFAEKDFYEPFAEWLRDGLDEVTEAIAIGGNIFKGKWNTPDVIGVLRPLKGDPIKFEPQIVAAEIKTDPTQPVVAFGQAISYRLFAHKCYLVLPDTTAEDDIERITALATVFGLGLVFFSLDPENPKFRLETRALLAQPDMIYVNQMAKRLDAYDSKGFDRLF